MPALVAASATSLRASAFVGRPDAIRARSSARRNKCVATTSSRRRSRGAVVTHANLFSRFTRVISSYANSLITAAEDPEKILDQTVNEMQGDLIKMRQATAQVMASQKQLETKYTAANNCLLYTSPSPRD